MASYSSETSDVDVTFTWQRDGNQRYSRDTCDARGPPKLLSRYMYISQSYAELRIGGERPVQVTIVRGDQVVFQDDIQTEKSCMKIHFKRRNRPSNFTVHLENQYGEDVFHFDIDS